MASPRSTVLELAVDSSESPQLEADETATFRSLEGFCFTIALHPPGGSAGRAFAVAALGAWMGQRVAKMTSAAIEAATEPSASKVSSSPYAMPSLRSLTARWLR